jgi:sulfur carrier protein
MSLDITRLRDVVVNGRPLKTGAVTLAALVSEQGFGGIKVATAMNGDFVAERARAETGIRQGDRVEILSVRQGG